MENQNNTHIINVYSQLLDTASDNDHSIELASRLKYEILWKYFSNWKSKLYVHVQIEANKELAISNLFNAIEGNIARNQSKFLCNLIAFNEQKKTVDRIKKEFKSKVTNLGYVKIKEKFK